MKTKITIKRSHWRRSKSGAVSDEKYTMVDIDNGRPLQLEEMDEGTDNARSALLAICEYIVAKSINTSKKCEILVNMYNDDVDYHAARQSLNKIIKERDNALIDIAQRINKTIYDNIKAAAVGLQSANDKLLLTDSKDRDYDNIKAAEAAVDTYDGLMASVMLDDYDNIAVDMVQCCTTANQLIGLIAGAVKGRRIRRARRWEILVV